VHFHDHEATTTRKVCQQVKRTPPSQLSSQVIHRLWPRPVPSASSQTSAKIPITSPATLSTKTQATHAASTNGTSSSTSKAATSTSTPTANAGHAMGGSLMATAEIAIGVIAML
jgi:hypothetical protein